MLDSQAALSVVRRGWLLWTIDPTTHSTAFTCSDFLFCGVGLLCAGELPLDDPDRFFVRDEITDDQESDLLNASETLFHNAYLAA